MLYQRLRECQGVNSAAASATNLSPLDGISDDSSTGGFFLVRGVAAAAEKSTAGYRSYAVASHNIRCWVVAAATCMRSMRRRPEMMAVGAAAEDGARRKVFRPHWREP